MKIRPQKLAERTCTPRVSASPDKATEDGRHERVSAALEEFVDPELKAAVKSECCAENFVLAEDQEKNTDAYAEQGERLAVASAGIRRKSHSDCHSIAEFLLQQNLYGG